ncbi:hypothetical protein Bca101_063022 [Brassica carinata]
MAISTFSSLLRYRKWAKSNWLVASLGLLLIVFSLSLFFDPTSDSVPSVDHNPPITSPSDLVKLKLSSKAKERGAFCLDGSLPGYHFSKGSGSGSKSWLVHLEISLTGTELRYVIVMVLLFLDVLKLNSRPDVLGNPTMRSFYHDVVKLQGLDKSLDQKCVARKEPSKCMFPQEFVNNIRTPVFLVNAAYDYWQIQHVLVPASADLDKSWAKCRLNIKECDAEQMKVLHGFRSSLMDAIGKFHQKKAGGMFIDSCYSHSQMPKPMIWHSPTSTRIKNKTIAESVGDWYFNRKPVKLIDCPYPCNPSCYNMNFT